MEKAKVPDLTEYLEAVSSNLNGPIPIFLGRIDSLLVVLVSNLDRPKWMASARMVAISFGSLRAAVFCNLMGATPQVPVLVRHAIEAAAYAYLFSRDSEYHKLWFKREIDKKAKEKFSRTGLARMREHLKREDQEFLNTVNDQLNYLISFGAHPNVFQVTGLLSTEMHEDGSGGVENIMILTGAEERADAYLMLMPGYTSVMKFIELLWPERFSLLCGRDAVGGCVREFLEYRQMRKAPRQQA